ncbi:MAG: YvrJ protein family [Bacillales bacterium]|jgi:hypothetical protein|nr:YvrJ protein family [Bacillales bacterium]
MQEIVAFIRDVGFPIVVSIYLLHRIETKLDDIVNVLTAMSGVTMVKERTIHDNSTIEA